MLEAVTGMIVAGSVMFWIILSVYVVMCLFFLEAPSKHTDISLGPLSLITFGLLVGLYIAGPLQHLFAFVLENKLTSLYFFLCYFAIGCIYSMVKFWNYMNKLKEKYLEYKERWLKNNFDSVYTSNYETLEIPKEKEQKYINDMGCGSAFIEIKDFATGNLKISDYKSAITSWIIWWPISGLWFIINEPIKRFANYLYTQFKHVYTKIYKAVIGKITGDLDLTDVPIKGNKINNIGKDENYKVT